jgi:LPS O-antigen subunit length determinant protein (WzzB/FepE family)
MQNNITEQNYYQEDEIDLKELFNTLWFKKNLIIGITVSITILAGIYAFNKTPIYEAAALVEIGNYKNNNNNNNNVLVDSVPELVKKLNLLFIDLLKNEKDRKATITSISTVKGTSNFINIKSESTSNKLASNEINKIVTYMQSKHQAELENIIGNRKSKITSIDRQISTIKNRQLELLSSNNNNLNRNEALLNSLQLISMINGELAIQSMSELIKEKTELGLLLNKRNYKNSEVVGRIITNDYPIKPKKKLIVTVAFIAGFILSIFLVFIMNAFRKEDDKATA